MKHYLFALLLFIVAQTMNAALYAPNLKNSGDIDHLVYRLSSRHGLTVPDWLYRQPIDAASLDSFLTIFSDSSYAGLLSQSELTGIQLLKQQIAPSSGFVRLRSKRDDVNLALHLSLLGDIRPGNNDSVSIFLKGIIAPGLTGNLGNLSFYSGLDVWTEYRSDTVYSRSSYQPYHGVPYNLYGRVDSGSVRASDLPRGGIRYDAGRIDIESAIDNLKQGPAVYFPLTFSGKAPPVTFARVMLDLDVVDYSHLAGILKSQKDKPKYLYTHRLNCALDRFHLQFGISEVIVTGSTTNEQDLDSANLLRIEYAGNERDWEWAYLLPFVPFKFVEHYAGDRDNAAIAFDVNVNWPLGFRWYAEIFLDDVFAPWKVLSDDWGNKWAFTAGTQYFGRTFNRDLTITAEYTRIEPWVYTHFYGGSHRYTHFGQSLGSVLGPNSQGIVVDADFVINRLNSAGIRFETIAINSSARGGKITDVFQDTTDSEIKRFLGPGTVWSVVPAIHWKFNPFGVFKVDLEYRVDITGKKTSSELAAWGGLVF